MSGLINFIKSLFSGIFGIFGGKNNAEAISGSAAKPASKKGNSGFYLELDEAKGTTAAQAASPAPAQTANGATAEANPGEAKSGKSSRKEKLAALAEGNASASPTPAPAKAPTATVVAAPAPKPAVFEPETEFATKYLVTNGNNSRRRPGANMSPYLDMARKINVG